MRKVLVDDHALFGDEAASLLLAWGHEDFGPASERGEAGDTLDESFPDVVLMNSRTPGASARDPVRTQARRPGVAIVMLTVSDEEAQLFRAIRAAAQGDLAADLESPLRSMLEGVTRGEPTISPVAPVRAQRLTVRELAVLRLVTEGLHNREIASRLGISENTVKFHLKNIVDKMHTQNRAELAARAVRDGLVPRHFPRAPQRRAMKRGG
jgi:DNA-binding NarL/FixJ family response regulator